MIQYENDSLIALWPAQGRLLLSEKYRITMFKEIIDSLQAQLNEASRIILFQKKVVSSLEQERNLNKQIADNYKSLEVRYQLRVEELNKEIVRRKKINKVLGGVTVIGVGLLLGLLLGG